MKTILIFRYVFYRNFREWLHTAWVLIQIGRYCYTYSLAEEIFLSLSKQTRMERPRICCKFHIIYQLYALKLLFLLNILPKTVMKLIYKKKNFLTELFLFKLLIELFFNLVLKMENIQIIQFANQQQLIVFEAVTNIKEGQAKGMKYCIFISTRDNNKDLILRCEVCLNHLKY